MTTPPALRRTWAVPVGGFAVSFGGLLAVGIGVGYDWAQVVPSEFSRAMIVSGVALITGVPWWLLGAWQGRIKRWAMAREDHHADE